MRREFTKAEIVTLIKTLDRRAANFTDSEIDIIIDMGYAELGTVVQVFSNEEIVPMDQFYDAGDLKPTIDIDQDVVGIYEYYLTIEDQPFEDYDHGIREYNDKNAIYLDNRYNGRVHIDLDQVPTTVGRINNAVVKYFYTPSSATDPVYMDQQTYLAMINSMSAAMYDYLHDVERAGQKRAAMLRTARSIVPLYPHDLIQKKPSMFPAGV